MIDVFAELYEIEDEDIREMRLDDVLYEEIFDSLQKKQLELIGRKADFAKKAGITP